MTLPSTISWLDQTAEQQRRVREIVALFTQPESRDELGIGQIRDVFSDRLFPGVSVIQTRARYALFVPWIFRLGISRGYAGPSLAAWAERQERRFIESLRAEMIATGQGQEGLVGRVAGTAVKILPSSIYWSGLYRWGILTHWRGPDELGLHDHDRTDLDELAERQVSDWHPTLPDPPEGFPDKPTGGFQLTAEEATWLRERFLLATDGSLLAHMVTARSRPSPTSAVPWEDPACESLEASLADTLNHARRFSTVMHAAALLYNLLVAELYEADALTAIKDPVATYRKMLAESEPKAAEEVRGWDLDVFWTLVATDNPRVSPFTRRFVNDWIDRLGHARSERLADDAPARQLVAQRERHSKGRQSRLENARLRQTWSGGSGVGQLNYRWGTVRTLVTDIIDGLPEGASAAS